MGWMWTSRQAARWDAPEGVAKRSVWRESVPFKSGGKSGLFIELSSCHWLSRRKKVTAFNTLDELVEHFEIPAA